MSTQQKKSANLLVAKIVFAIFLLVSTFGCGTDVYFGTKASAYYPDKLFGKEMGDPRKDAFATPQEPSGVTIGGHRKVFRTIGGGK